MITRFAPSPTGYLHLGHALSAVTGWTAARAENGTFLVRIDDLDESRCRPDYEAALIEDLTWLGLDWPRPMRRQSAHLADYAAATARLRALDVLYPCFCSRTEIRAEVVRLQSAPQGPDGPLYPGTCRGLTDAERASRIADGAPHSWRLDVERAAARTGPLRWHDRLAGWQTARPETLGDVMIARRDLVAGYHLSVVVDDDAQGVTVVTRGADLFPSTHVHRLLQALLEIEVPDHLHHRLVTDAQGQRLAKRADSVAIRAFRAAGRTPTEVLEMVSRDRA